VHTSKGKVYLRSRPGHHFNQIHFKQKDYGKEKDFKDAVRETGEIKEGQCIWGFINGLFNMPKGALRSASLISNLAGGEHVWYLVNDMPGSLLNVTGQKLGHHSKSVKFGAQFFKMLIRLSDQDSSQPNIVIFTHSQGAIIANLALERLKPQERQRIHIFTIGGASLIEPNFSHPESHNYFSKADLVAKITSYNFTLFLLQLHEGQKMGLAPEQVIQRLIHEDIGLYLESHDQEAIAIFRRQREKYYEYALWKSQNITILNEDTWRVWEHALTTPCYQQILGEIINKYQRE